MFGLGIKEIVIIVLVLLLLVGWKKLPKMAKKAATKVNEVKDVLKK